MSHYSEVKTTFKDDKALISALIDLGFLKGEIEVSKMPVKLGNSTSSAHIIVRKATIQASGKFGHAYTDLGFEKLADGTFKAHIDDYTFSKKVQNQLKQRYDYRLQMERLRRTGHQLSETTNSKGEIVVIARR